MSEPSPDSAATASPWRERLAVAALGAAGLALAFYPMLLSSFAQMQADVGDTRHLNFVLEHVHRWLVRAPGHAPLFSPPIFYPEPNTGAYTELLLAVVPFYSAWRALGLAADSAFQAWMVTVAALNYACAYLLFRAGIRSSRLASAAGAFLILVRQRAPVPAQPPAPVAALLHGPRAPGADPVRRGRPAGERGEHGGRGTLALRQAQRERGGCERSCCERGSRSP